MNMERAAEEEGDGDAAQSTRLAEEEDNDELADDEGVPLEATHACSSSLSSSSSSLDTPGSSVSSSSEWSGQASASTTAPRPYKATRDRRKECIAFFQQELGQKNFTVIERTPHKLRELLADAVRAAIRVSPEFFEYFGQSGEADGKREGDRLRAASKSCTNFSPFFFLRRAFDPRWPRFAHLWQPQDYMGGHTSRLRSLFESACRQFETDHEIEITSIGKKGRRVKPSGDASSPLIPMMTMLPPLTPTRAVAAHVPLSMMSTLPMQMPGAMTSRKAKPVSSLMPPEGAPTLEHAQMQHSMTHHQRPSGEPSSYDAHASAPTIGMARKPTFFPTTGVAYISANERKHQQYGHRSMTSSRPIPPTPESGSYDFASSHSSHGGGSSLAPAFSLLNNAASPWHGMLHPQAMVVGSAASSSSSSPSPAAWPGATTPFLPPALPNHPSYEVVYGLSHVAIPTWPMVPSALPALASSEAVIPVSYDDLFPLNQPINGAVAAPTAPAASSASPSAGATQRNDPLTWMLPYGRPPPSQ